jgi:DNA double-strand break repair helicase HerA and related ATPase
MLEGLPIAKGKDVYAVLPRMANRHGLIAGATGTGKTVTLRVIAENLSKAGVPVFMADVKGDLSGIARPGEENSKISERLKALGVEEFHFNGYPTVFWDVFGQDGHPIRTTISDMGPLFMGRLLNLNETQSGVLNLVFKIADDNGMLLLDLKDLRAMLQYVGDNAAQFKTQYGNVSAASIGAIQRGLLVLEEQGGDKFFGEPALDLDDLMQTGGQGRGTINVLVADKLINAPKLYATFLLWLMSELFERLPEIGDPEKPKLAFFFDEAHLLFNDAPKALLEKIEQVVRLIRSKGIGVYFITQNPLDVPDAVLGQLGNRVQHALRAFTPRDQKAVKAAATTFRQNKDIDVETVITELGVGEALVSFLNDKGQPNVVDRALIYPPESQLPPLSAAEREETVKQSTLYGHYEKLVDRESAYEMLKTRAPQATAGQSPPSSGGAWQSQAGEMVEAFGKSAVRAIGSQLGREIMRGVLGSIFGSTTTRRRR